MKPKKFNKKLALNKKTIANLNHGHLGNVMGGNAFTPAPCESPDRTEFTICLTGGGGLKGPCCITQGESICDTCDSCGTCFETNCSNPCC